MPGATWIASCSNHRSNLHCNHLINHLETRLYSLLVYHRINHLVDREFLLVQFRHHSHLVSHQNNRLLSLKDNHQILHLVSNLPYSQLWIQQHSRSHSRSKALQDGEHPRRPQLRRCSPRCPHLTPLTNLVGSPLWSRHESQQRSPVMSQPDTPSAQPSTSPSA